jgi:hypothetical protein
VEIGDHTGGEGAGASLREVRLNWNHLLVQDAHDANAAKVGTVEHNMFSNFKSAKPGADCLAKSSQ